MVHSRALYQKCLLYIYIYIYILNKKWMIIGKGAFWFKNFKKR